MHEIAFFAEEDVGPGVGTVFMAAHEETRALGGDALDHLPGLHVDDADFRLLDVGGGQYGGVAVFPGNARRQVGHALDVQAVRDSAKVEVEYAGAALAG